MSDFVQWGFWLCAAMLVVCLIMAWVWPRRDT